jgi:tubulin beta
VNSLYVGSDPNASGCGNNWARGYYTEGAELSESLLELTRKEAERTDAMGSIVLYHAASGGTGGGAGSAVLARLREEYPEVHLATCTVLPSFKYNPPPPTLNKLAVRTA